MPGGAAAGPVRGLTAPAVALDAMKITDCKNALKVQAGRLFGECNGEEYAQLRRDFANQGAFLYLQNFLDPEITTQLIAALRPSRHR
jgi:hypothetical protein